MTKTERARKSGAEATELRRYVVALLATMYAVAWWSFEARAPRSSAAVAPGATRPRSPAEKPAGAIWYDDLPAAQRPSVALPSGWQLAGSAALAEPDPVPVRVRPSRRGRVRTRSS